MSKLSKEEREILEAYEGGELKSIANVNVELQRYQAYAAAANSREEEEILKALEEDRLVPAKDQAEILKEHRKAAVEMLKKKVRKP